MTDEELFDALDALFAFDVGSTDSGVHDEALRERVKKELAEEAGGLTAAERLTRFSMRFTSLVDVAEFLRWLSEYMDIDL